MKSARTNLRKRSAAMAAQTWGPRVSAGYVRGVLDQAIDGVGPIRSAVGSAKARLVEYGGDVEDAVSALVFAHLKYASAQGFVTNVGGLATVAVSVPANITGLALVQSHLVAGLAHLRGYDLADPRVRNAVLMCLLGSGRGSELVRSRQLPSTPMGVATAPVYDSAVDEKVNNHVAEELFALAAGKRAVILVGRRVPLVGGSIGAATDAVATGQIAAYARVQFPDRGIAEYQTADRRS